MEKLNSLDNLISKSSYYEDEFVEDYVNYNILKSDNIDDHLIMYVDYWVDRPSDCQDLLQGKYVMVFNKYITYKQIKKQGSLKPYVGVIDMIAPFAIFEPTELGYSTAIFFAQTIGC